MLGAPALTQRHFHCDRVGGKLLRTYSDAVLSRLVLWPHPPCGSLPSDVLQVSHVPVTLNTQRPEKDGNNTGIKGPAGLFDTVLVSTCMTGDIP